MFFFTFQSRMGVPAEGREANQSDKYGFNLLFFKRFWRLHKIFFPGRNIFFLLLMQQSQIDVGYAVKSFQCHTRKIKKKYVASLHKKHYADLLIIYR